LIGAIDAALIAGNHEAGRLQWVKAFWDRIGHPDGADMARIDDDRRRVNILPGTFDTVMRGAPGFFTPRHFSGFFMGMTVPPETASCHDTMPLRAGELVHFDGLNGELCADHVRASCSLPPAFPPVRVDGEL